MDVYPQKSAFHGPIIATIILMIPYVFVGLKYAYWDTYGVFDYYTFYMAGELANSGAYTQLYDPEIFHQIIVANYDGAADLPWLYPPLLLPYCQFLALFPIAESYLLYGVFSVSFYYWVIRQIFPEDFRDILILSVLPIVVALAFGHPTVLLLALLVLGYGLAKRNHIFGSLVAFTLCSTKPHIGGVVLFLYFIRTFPKSFWLSLGIAIAVIAGTSLAYSIEIWPLFLNQLRVASGYLQSQTFNAEWASSAFIMLQTLGMPHLPALGIHFFILFLLCLIAYLAFQTDKEARFWVLAGSAAVFTSPYLMYYDLGYLLFPLALVLEKTDVVKRKNWTYVLFFWEIIMLSNLGEFLDININFVLITGFMGLLLYSGKFHITASCGRE